MNPDPVIVTGVSGEPAMVEEGVTAVMAGAGFGVGGGFEAGVPPPQPVIRKEDRTQEKTIHVMAPKPGSNGLRWSMATSGLRNDKN
jgi:hypothetical protein